MKTLSCRRSEHPYLVRMMYPAALLPSLCQGLLLFQASQAHCSLLYLRNLSLFPSGLISSPSFPRGPPWQLGLPRNILHLRRPTAARSGTTPTRGLRSGTASCCPCAQGTLAQHPLPRTPAHVPSVCYETPTPPKPDPSPQGLQPGLSSSSSCFRTRGLNAGPNARLSPGLNPRPNPGPNPGLNSAKWAKSPDSWTSWSRPRQATPTAHTCCSVPCSLEGFSPGSSPRARQCREATLSIRAPAVVVLLQRAFPKGCGSGAGAAFL